MVYCRTMHSGKLEAISTKALRSDGWTTDPFMLVEKEGKLYGRESTDDKEPIMGSLNVLEAHQTQNLELPVSLRFCFEGMEESGSEGLDELIEKEVAEGQWFKGVDYVCVTVLEAVQNG